MALVYSSDFDGLPLEPIPRWLKLRDLLETRLSGVDDERNGISEEHLVEYCTVLTSAAEEMGLGNFDNFHVGDIRTQFPLIRSEIIALSTKLSMRTAVANAAHSVALSRPSKIKLLKYVERLRAMVGASDLSDKQKKRLNVQLDELQQTILAPRTDFGRVMTVIAAVSLVISETTSFLADAPDAWKLVGSFVAAIGEEKRYEEEAQQRIDAAKEPLRIEDLRDGNASDDEVPF